MAQDGPLIVSITGPFLSESDKRVIQHPQLGGVILFGRNFIHTQQLQQLVADIRGLNSELLLFVDQEGGVVQRFKDKGFLPLPAVCLLGQLWDLGESPAQIASFSHALGLVMAAQVRAAGVDVSFAPVLDAPGKASVLLENRAFHRQPDKVLHCANAYIEGMRAAGMPATGKHYPGHGGVGEDSHFCMPIDSRDFAQIMQTAEPFVALMQQGLEGVMAAHVQYAGVDNEPAGFSRFWLKDVLRQQYQFDGVVFSDDLMMEGAAIKGDPASRVMAALDAGCDYAIVCNDEHAILDILSQRIPTEHEGNTRRRAFYQKSKIGSDYLTILESQEYLAAVSKVQQFNDKLTSFSKIAH